MLFEPYRAVLTYVLKKDDMYITTRENVEYNYLHKMRREKWTVADALMAFTTYRTLAAKYKNPSEIYRRELLIPYSLTIGYDVPTKCRTAKLGVHMGLCPGSFTGIEVEVSTNTTDNIVTTNADEICQRSGLSDPYWTWGAADLLTDVSDRNIQKFHRPISAIVKDVVRARGPLKGLNKVLWTQFSVLAKYPSTRAELISRITYDIAAHMNHLLGGYELEDITKETADDLFSIAKIHVCSYYMDCCCSEDSIRNVLFKLGIFPTPQDDLVKCMMWVLNSSDVLGLLNPTLRTLSNWTFSGYSW